MFQRLVRTVQNKYHPLHRLRRHRIFLDVVMPLFDFEVGSRLYGIDWSVQVRLARHLSWILNSRSGKPGITSLFLAMSKVLRPQVFWDVGACLGFYSWLLMSRDKDLKAVLFEPDPDNASLITSTIRRQRLEGVRLVDRAVSDICGRAPFACDKAAGATGRWSWRQHFRRDCTARSRR